MHGFGQRVRGIGAQGVFHALRVLVQRLEHEGQIHAVGRAQSAVVAGAPPGEGIGPGLAAGPFLAFQNLVGRHSEDEVGLEGREQIAGSIAAAGLAVAFHDVGGEARSVHEVLERFFTYLVDGSARHGVVAPFLFGGADHDVQILGGAVGNGVHGALHENVAVNVGLEYGNVSLQHAAPFGILGLGGSEGGEGEQFFWGEGGHGVAAVFNAVEGQQIGGGHGSLLAGVLSNGRGTLENGAPEKTFRLSGGNEGGYVRGSRGLAEYRDLVGIAAEGGNVVLHPAQGEHHVAQGEVGRHTLDFEEAVHVHAVVDGNEYHAVLRKGRAVEAYVIVVAAGAAAAGNIDHDGALRLAGRGCPDVQAQAVAAAQYFALAAGLERNVAGRDGIDDAVPGRNEFRQGQAVFSFIGGHAAGHASEHMHAVHDKTAHAAFGRFDHGAFGGKGMEGHGACENRGRTSIQKLTSVHVKLLIYSVMENANIRPGE